MSDQTGTPGAGNGAGRSEGASGKLMAGGKKLSGGGTNFDYTSAQNQRSDRQDHGQKPSGIKKETLTAERRG